MIDEKKYYDEETSIIYRDIPYKAGKLEVIGLNESGDQVSKYAVQSSGRPYAIKVISEGSTIEKGGVAQVVIQVVDEQGVPVMLSDDEVKCQIHGDARLLGLEASNNSDMSDYTENKQRVFHGRMIAYIKAGSEADTIEVRFSANWLKPAIVEIEVK